MGSITREGRGFKRCHSEVLFEELTCYLLLVDGFVSSCLPLCKSHLCNLVEKLLCPDLWEVEFQVVIAIVVICKSLVNYFDNVGVVSTGICNRSCSSCIETLSMSLHLSISILISNDVLLLQFDILLLNQLIKLHAGTHHSMNNDKELSLAWMQILFSR